MPDRPKSPAAKRAAMRNANRLARVRAALDAGDDATYLLAAVDFARGAIKRRDPAVRGGHRSALAELIVNYALNEIESDDITRMEHAA